MSAIHSLSPELTGISSPDPLKFAFAGKKSAHTSSGSIPVPADQTQAVYRKLMDTPALPETLSPGKRLAYIHIPFCRTHCSYCGFFQNTTKKDEVNRYVDYLEKEIRMSAHDAWTQSGLFHGVYFGGGTPTDLQPEHIVRLGNAIRESLPLANDVEMTFEGRFHGFDNDKVQACLEAGFNRFSLGAQSFNTTLRRRMSRIDSGEFLLERLDYFNSLNNAAVVIDLMFGLPGQTLGDWEKDLHTFLQSKAHGVDLYQLILLGSSRMKQSIENGSMPEPATSPERAEMFRLGVATLSDHKVGRLSVSHWGRDLRERNIYNHGVKSGAEIMPFGSGAGGNFAGHNAMSLRTLPAYYEAIDAGHKPIMMMSKATGNKALFSVMGSGFDRGWLEIAKLDQTGGAGMSEHCMPLFEAWQENGLTTIHDGILDLTLPGQFWNVTMHQALIDFLKQYPLDGQTTERAA
ncbi:heme anaerobic degradation radical SAM methyltransferase ChuW/HutW [Endozoicomonas ascidiicola]|uniref:heme anaerobic degradation radical SAM methyltransferase ChuW/HutW n=1 Tax=Endozoicomonas ascidiicola TaxID=1698521 RepID=UPI000832F8FB|nr:heme anaerobic degradation radical SAM methyltransferase ChuW/HutW [Endozoicomonas ascidiicola]